MLYMASDSIMPAMLQAEKCHPDWNVSQEEGNNRDHKELRGVRERRSLELVSGLW